MAYAHPDNSCMGTAIAGRTSKIKTNEYSSYLATTYAHLFISSGYARPSFKKSHTGSPPFILQRRSARENTLTSQGVASRFKVDRRACRMLAYSRTLGHELTRVLKDGRAAAGRNTYTLPQLSFDMAMVSLGHDGGESCCP